MNPDVGLGLGAVGALRAGEQHVVLRPLPEVVLAPVVVQGPEPPGNVVADGTHGPVINTIEKMLA